MRPTIVRKASIGSKIEAHARKGWFFACLREETECSGHAEMQCQPAAAARQKVLAMSLGCDELGALEPADECLRGHPFQYALIVHGYPFDRLAQSASDEHLLENFDIGQFGHFGSARFAATVH